MACLFFNLYSVLNSSTLFDSSFSVTKLLIVEIPSKLLKIVLFKTPTAFLTAKYLGDRFFWKKNAITKIIGIGKIDIEATSGDI